MDFQKFTIDLRKLGKAFGLPADWINERPPATPFYDKLVAQHGASALRSGPADARLQQKARLEIEVLDEWRIKNTAIFFHVEPAIDIDGPFFMRDTHDIEGYTTEKGVADGRGIVNWALKKVDLTTKVRQRALSRQLGSDKLDASSTRAQFAVHYDRLYQHWELLSDSDPLDRESLSEFYDQLVDTMPTTPASSHLVSLRTWLVGQVVAFKGGAPEAAPFKERYEALDALMEYAKTLGVPAGNVTGSGVSQPALLVISPDGEIIFPGDEGAPDAAAEDAAAGGTVMALGGGKPSNGRNKAGRRVSKPPGQSKRATNKCTFCDNWCCQSDDHGGPDFCVSRHGSKFDLSKVHDGQAQRVRATRVWHKANPNATTLKGVMILIRKATEEETARGAGGSSRASNGTLAPIIDAEELMGADGVSADPEFDAWLKGQGASGPGLFVITSDGGEDAEPCDECEADEAAAPEAAALAEAQAQLADKDAELLELRRQLATVSSAGQDGGRRSSAGAGFGSPEPTLPPRQNPALTPIDRSLLVGDVDGGGDKAKGVSKPPTPPTRKPTVKDKDSVDHLASVIVAQNHQVKKYKEEASKPIAQQIVDRLAEKISQLTGMACELSFRQWITRVALARLFGPHLVPLLCKLAKATLAYGNAQVVALLKTAGQQLVHRISLLLVKHTTALETPSLPNAVESMRSHALQVIKGAATKVAMTASELAADASSTAEVSENAPELAAEENTVPAIAEAALVQRENAETQTAPCDEETPTIMMIAKSAGGKRKMTDAEVMEDIDGSQEDSDKFILGALRATVEVLHATTTDKIAGVPRMFEELNQLAVALGISGSNRSLREQGLNALRAALVHVVWPDVYPTLKYACEVHSAGRTKATQYAQVIGKKIDQCFADRRAWSAWVATCADSKIGRTVAPTHVDHEEAASTLSLLGNTTTEEQDTIEGAAVQETEPSVYGLHVAATLGTTGNADAPVKLFLDCTSRDKLDESTTLACLIDVMHETTMAELDFEIGHSQQNMAVVEGSGERDPFDVCLCCLEVGDSCSCNPWVRPPDYNSADELDRFMHWSRGSSPTGVVNEGVLMPIGLLWQSSSTLLAELDSVQEEDSAAQLQQDACMSGMSEECFRECLFTGTALVVYAGKPDTEKNSRGKGTPSASFKARQQKRAAQQAADMNERCWRSTRTRDELSDKVKWIIAHLVHLRRTKRARKLESQRRRGEGWHSSNVNSAFRWYPRYRSYDGCTNVKWRAARMRAGCVKSTGKGWHSYRGMPCDGYGVAGCTIDDDRLARAEMERELHDAEMARLNAIQVVGRAVVQRFARRVCLLGYADMLGSRLLYGAGLPALGTLQRQLDSIACTCVTIADLMAVTRARLSYRFDAQRAHGQERWGDWWQSVFQPVHANGVLMAIDAESDIALSFPPGTLRDSTGCIPALSDNGASYKAGCSKTLVGALQDTFSETGSGDLTIGDEHTKLRSRGSYLFVLERYGSDGAGEIVTRRLRHTPDLPMTMVFSEPTEVYQHRYAYHFTHTDGRVMVTTSGVSIPLFMSRNKLGYLKVRAVTDPSVIARARAAGGADGSDALLVIGDGTLRSVGMPVLTLQGVDLLRREHVINSHLPLRPLLRLLKAKGKLGSVTKDQIMEFAKQGCGACESARMKRRPFTLQTVTDHTRAPVGKKWIVDELQLKVPSAGHAYTYLFVAVDDGSGVRFIFGMRGMSADDQIRARDQLRAVVRPDHGDIWVIRADSLPGHRARKVVDYSAGAVIKDELSPPYVHEGVHKAEVTMMHGVPAANALLMSALDLGDPHFPSAFRTAVLGMDYAPNGTEEQPTSNMMRYNKRTDWMHNPLYVYGSACKALVHPEARDDKYQHHAFPAVYTGPAFNSHSPAHCSVWSDGYTDVDVGCVNIDERAIIARTQRTHPSHQPFNQVGTAQQIVPSTDVWYDPSSQLHPLEQAARSARLDDAAGALPRYAGTVWTSVSAEPVRDFVLVLGSGRAHDGDFASWLHAVSNHEVDCIRIDPKVGGYAHRVDREEVCTALERLAGCTHSLGVFLQLPCGPWCSSKFRGDGGPTPIFTADHRDGIVVNGEVHHAARDAMILTKCAVRIARVALQAGKHFMSEHPVSHGRGSLLYSHKLQLHSNMHQTSVLVSLIAEFGLVSVYTDQGASGHDHRKCTDLLCSRRLYAACLPVLGTLRLPDNWKSAAPPLSGKDADGVFNTKAAEVYPVLFAERLGRVWVAAISSAGAAIEGGEMSVASQQLHAADDSTATTFAIGDRIEVYWTKEKRWFAGVVQAVTTQKHKKLGMMIEAPAVQVQYDDGVKLTHSMHNNDMRLEEPDALPSLMVIRTDRKNDGESKSTETEAEFMLDVNLEEDSVLLLYDLDIEIETGEIVNKASLFTVSTDGTLTLVERVSSMDTLNARYWHCPENERDYERSPQRGLWRTAKELKWDQYLALNMFDWIPISSIDRNKHRIYSTLWAYAIKLNADLTFRKLNPRWCLKGGTMDRDKFKSHAETLRIASFRILLALKAGYWDAFCEFLLDCSDAFQTTRTDGSDAEDHAPLYCYPAAGFERTSESGERLVCKVNVGMQGRIDATRLFNSRLFGLLLVKAGITRSLWDRQLMIYHQSEKRGTSSSLSDILTHIKTATDTAPQQPPIGYALIGWHVDDGTGLACCVGWNRDLATNRVLQYLKGTIETIYATTLTGWHGKKALGFALTLGERTVNMSAPDAVAQLSKDLIKGTVNVSPKHAITKEFFGIPAGTVPEVGDPRRDTILADMALARHAMGVFIWLQQAYIEIARGNNELCSNMAYPNTELTLKCCRHQSMYLSAFGKGITYGPCSFGLERADSVDATTPLRGPKLQFFHYFSDANLEIGSVTGGIGMLAKGAIIIVSQRQHLANPNSHAAEITAAGTNYNFIVPSAGVLQELHVLCGSRVPFYLDSSSSVFVAKSDTAVKKSVWLIRRAAVLEDGVVHNEIEPLHISERDMVADPFTKYLVYGVWIRHMHYALNYPGELPKHPNDK